MADINENQIFEALGIEQTEQTAAQPAEEPAAAEAANPVQAATEEAAEPAAAEVMDEETRRENAARRRKQEQQAAIDAAVNAARREEREKAQNDLSDFFKKAKLKNTLTGEPITNMDQFNDWDRSYADAQLQRNLKAGKMTREDIDAIVNDNPIVKKAQSIVAAEETARRQQQDAEAAEKINAEIEEIGKLNPAIKSVKDLTAMPNAKQFYDYVKRGLSFVDAYYLTNRAEVEAAKAEAVRQSAMNNARGKDHLSATGNSRGAGAATVPNDEMAMFRLFNPNATQAEIAAYYNKNKR